MKRIMAVPLGLALILPMIPAASVGADEAGALTPINTDWITPPSEPEVDTLRLTINDASFPRSPVAGASMVMGTEPRPTDGEPWNVDQFYCEGYDDPQCRGRTITSMVHLPLCSEDIVSDCMEQVIVTKGDEVIEARPVGVLDFSGTIPKPEELGFSGSRVLGVYPVQDVRADAERGLPAGTSVGLWEVPGVAQLDQDSLFAVDAGMQLQVEKNGSISLSKFHVGVVPVVRSEMPMNRGAYFATRIEPDGDVRLLGYKGSFSDDCAYQDSYHCYSRADFPQGVDIAVTMRLSARLGGWLHGRVEDPRIDITPIDGQTNRVTIAGEPLTVPVAHREIPISELPPGRNYKRPSWYTGTRPYFPSSTLSANYRHDFDWFANLLPLLGERSDAMLSTWSVKSTTAETLHPCLSSTNELVGLVTTNAMMYDGGPPGFTRNRINYQVGGLHYQPGGDETRGYYSLVMRSDAARCLYRYSQAPITAEITVTGEGGGEQVATTSMSERNGWLSLRAENFTFSTPIIEAALIQQKAKSKSLVCIKKKTKKQGPKRIVVKGERGEKLTCPKGYRPKPKRR